LGLLPQEIVQRQQAVIQKFGLPTSCPDIDKASVLQAMELDKKVRGKALRWVLLEGIGEVVIRDDVPQEVVVDVIQQILSTKS
jgi:3-dehydroquinate synthetase